MKVFKPYQVPSSPYGTINAALKAHYDKIRDIAKRVKAGERIYVTFTNSADLRRTGAIAYLTHYEVRENRAFWNSKVNETRPSIDYMAVAWDDRRSGLRVWNMEVDILEDYKGPTVWKWEKPEGPLVEAKDRTGREIKKGDFITYVLHHHVHYGTTIHFGTVTKVDRDGTVWAKNIKVNDEETVAEKRIKHNENIVVLTKDLLDVLMLKKLASS